MVRPQALHAVLAAAGAWAVLGGSWTALCGLLLCGGDPERTLGGGLALAAGGAVTILALGRLWAWAARDDVTGDCKSTGDHVVVAVERSTAA